MARLRSMTTAKEVLDSRTLAWKDREVDDDELTGLRALAHPVRLRMLSLLTGASLSAAELARELGITQANASYHVRLLERSGLARVVEEVVVRGGTARRYRHEPGSPATRQVDEAAHGDLEDRAAFTRLIAAELVRRHDHRLPGPATHVDAELWVPPELWQQVVDLVNSASAKLHGGAGRPRAPDLIRVSMSAVLFEMIRDEG